MKKISWLLAVFSILMVPIQGAAWNYPEDPRIKEMFGLMATEDVYYPTDNPMFKRTGVSRFSFWFDLPLSWRSIDYAMNGDGRALLNGLYPEVKTDVWGGYNVLWDDDDFFEHYVGEGSEVCDFQFRDGGWGKHITYSSGTQSFIRIRDGVVADFSVEAPAQWMEENEELILYIARSLRWGYVDEDGVPMYHGHYKYCPACGSTAFGSF